MQGKKLTWICERQLASVYTQCVNILSLLKYSSLSRINIIAKFTYPTLPAYSEPTTFLPNKNALTTISMRLSVEDC